MYAPQYEFAGFETFGEADRAAIFDLMLEALVYADLAWLRQNRRAPLIYSSGVRYLKEAPDRDQWQDVLRCLELGTGDCEDLAAWRVAELRLYGEHTARCTTRRFTDDRGGAQYHILVQRAGGMTEDPSRVLGMP